MKDVLCAGGNLKPISGKLLSGTIVLLGGEKMKKNSSLFGALSSRV